MSNNGRRSAKDKERLLELKKKIKEKRLLRDKAQKERDKQQNEIIKLCSEARKVGAIWRDLEAWSHVSKQYLTRKVNH